MMRCPDIYSWFGFVPKQAQAQAQARHKQDSRPNSRFKAHLSSELAQIAPKMSAMERRVPNTVI
jgi:hypothetical protein